ncbi:FAD-dependent oxidoreductase [Amnibacterium flavum]|uniref:Amine oxidase domain-containing protein n=1 Tax=Amnibacterium flavum TaxID=2173173 RepID=A0A2V1HWV3_9MICO|nr:NAD(P)/FAD-dependent oxidoreductase [Amnibacterium flavum]PVZ94714.1 hypothetical protein DDQ50_13605 [Amnibacterium flavum]
MSFSRRTFLTGAATGFSVLVLTACTPEAPKPTPTRTVAPTPDPVGPVPAPTAIVRSDWLGDEFSRGSHSFVAAGASPEQRAVLGKHLDGRIFFAGEATSIEQPATVDGAAQSGLSAAGEVLAYSTEGERIAIIGAGAAGAAAASRLVDSGLTVTVIEARDRIGGRIATLDDEDWPVPVELGAAWAPESGSAVSLRLASLGIETVALERDRLLRLADGTDVDPSDSGDAAITSAVDWAADRPEDSTITESLDGSGAGDADDSGDPPTARDRIDLALLEHIAIDRGAYPDEISSWYGVALPAAPTEERVLGGYARYITDQLDGTDVWLSSAVTALSYGDNGVSIRLATGESISVDRAIVTVPLGVLKQQGITFDPALPFEHRAAIADLGFGTTETIWLRFDEKFWDTDAVRWSVIGSDLAITEWVNLEPLTGEAVLVGALSGSQSAVLAGLDDDAVLVELSSSLMPFLAES